jgi:hypothetical protein
MLPLLLPLLLLLLLLLLGRVHPQMVLRLYVPHCNTRIGNYVPQVLSRTQTLKLPPTSTLAHTSYAKLPY